MNPADEGQFRALTSVSILLVMWELRARLGLDEPSASALAELMGWRSRFKFHPRIAKDLDAIERQLQALLDRTPIIDAHVQRSGQLRRHDS